VEVTGAFWGRFLVVRKSSIINRRALVDTDVKIAVTGLFFTGAPERVYSDGSDLIALILLHTVRNVS